MIASSSSFTTYRAAVGACLLNEAHDRILVFQRSDTGTWQLPQGGIEPLETPEDALWREVAEETGFTQKDLRIVAEIPPRLLAYTLPHHLQSEKTGLGQTVLWYYLQFHPDTWPVPQLGAEFTTCRWMPWVDFIDEWAAAFKRSMYEALQP